MTSRTALLLAVLVGCKAPDLELDFGDARVDATESGPGAFPGLIVVPNLDDDDLDGTRDAEAPALADGEDDLAQVVIPTDVFVDAKADRLVLALTGTDVRVWHDGKVVLGEGLDSWTVPVDGQSVELSVEALRPLARGHLVLRSTKKNGETLDHVGLEVTGAPLILNHHLQPAEQVWVMATSDSGFSNAAMVADLRAVLGDKLQTLNPRRYAYDVWVQDEPELGTLTAPDHRMDLVLDSVRDRGLDSWPESLWQPGFTSETWGDTRASSYDSFGNLEVTPPVDGYPYGRVYYGAVGSAGPVYGLRDNLDAQLVQAPFTLDTTWLCVGHVDEFTSFVPDPTAPRGFRFLVADVDAGYALLDSLDADAPLPKYDRDFGYATVGDLRGDSTLRTYNEGLQDDKIEPNIQRFKDAIGLTNDEIVRIPGLFERVGGCGAAALIPGTVNLIVADVDGQTHLFLPDPFLREDLQDQSTDPLIAAVEAKLPASTVPHFVDNWDVYHLGLGEVHCGVNVQRTPYGAWWEDALDELEAAR